MEEIQRETQQEFGRRFCIDTSVAIELIKKEGNLRIMNRLNLDAAPCVVSAVTMFELLMRPTNLLPVERFLFRVRVLPFEEKAAKKASEIHKELLKKGKPVNFRDVFIAATAIVNNCDFLTLNKKDFENIEGLKVVEL